MSKTEMFDRDEMYWFARGYRDGRELGCENYRPEFSPLRRMYTQGYNTGVSDYAEALNIEADDDPTIREQNYQEFKSLEAE